MRLLLLQDANKVLLVARLEILKLRLDVLLIEAGKILFVFQCSVVLSTSWSSCFMEITDVLPLRTPSDTLNLLAVDVLVLGVVGPGTLSALTLDNALEAELVAYDARRHLLYQV